MRVLDTRYGNRERPLRLGRDNLIVAGGHGVFMEFPQCRPIAGHLEDVVALRDTLHLDEHDLPV